MAQETGEKSSDISRARTVSFSTATSLGRSSQRDHHHLQQKHKQRLHWCKYRVRYYSSKGASLVLLWNFAVWAANGSPFTLDDHPIGNLQYEFNTAGILQLTIPCILWLVVAVLSGWLADVYCGSYTMVHGGIILMWIGMVISSVQVLVDVYLISNVVVKNVFFAAIMIFTYGASAAFLVNSIPLGINQMPLASADELTAFIYSFTLTMYFAIWISNVALIKISYLTSQVVFAVLMTIALCSDLLLRRKWLITHFETCNPHKLVYQVLRFSAQHKVPVQRSALTYWEEELPSRMNLGKSKYGGPFTTEQVEDVKTFLRILIIALPAAVSVWAASLAEMAYEHSSHINVTGVTYNKTLDSLTDTIIDHSAADQSLWVIIFLVLNEIVLYPLFRNWIPTMLQRIGTSLFLGIIYSLVFLTVNTAGYIQDITINKIWMDVPISIIGALHTALLTVTSLEFVCAQAPHTMRGFLIGFLWSIYGLAITAGRFVFVIWFTICADNSQSVCGVVYYASITVINILGFAAYCVAAKWYRKRERDEPSIHQSLVEEVYGRYLSPTYPK